MSEISKLLADSQNPQQRLMAETRGLVGKWEKTGLLEGLSSDQEKSGMAVLLENQAKQLIDEASSTNMNNKGSEEWSGVALPLVRRVFAEIAAKEFVSVQPMNLPSGLIFFLDFKYGSDQSKQGSSGDDSLFGGGSGSAFGRTEEASGGLYGDGRHGYSINDVSVGLAATAAGVIVLPDDADLDGVRAFTYTDSANNKFSVDADGKTSDGAGNAAAESTNANGSLQYHVKTTDSARGDFEDDGTTASAGTSGLAKDIGIPEVNLELKSEPIVAKTRKLKAVWTPELAQDLNAYHSVDAEAELTSLLSEYVSMEIDLEILDMLITGAGTTGETFNAVPDSLQGGETQGTYFQRLGVIIQSVSNKIHQLTLRGGANFLVCSPQVATILESIPGYAVDTDGNSSQFAMGVQKVGMLNNRFQVYKNPYMTSGTILAGFRGSNFLETGAVYSPYIPLIQTPLVYDPVNFTPRRGVMTRYAKKMVRPEFYATIEVTNFDGVLGNYGSADGGE